MIGSHIEELGYTVYSRKHYIWHGIKVIDYMIWYIQESSG